MCWAREETQGGGVTVNVTTQHCPWSRASMNRLEQNIEVRNNYPHDIYSGEFYVRSTNKVFELDPSGSSAGGLISIFKRLGSNKRWPEQVLFRATPKTATCSMEEIETTVVFSYGNKQKVTLAPLYHVPIRP